MRKAKKETPLSRWVETKNKEIMRENKESMREKYTTRRRAQRRGEVMPDYPRLPSKPAVRELATLCKCSPHRLYNYIYGRTDPPLSIALTLSQHTGIAIEDLVSQDQQG
jgi:hypothetical protein